ncbi:MAG TPA: hypothetical protein VM901_06110 [Bdellovibrionota bacterium]|nr:hypothetical protein [Bdellovibrionota bacterium]
MKILTLALMSAPLLAFAQNVAKTAPRVPAAAPAEGLGKNLATLNDYRVELLALDVQKRNKTDAAFVLIGDMNSANQLERLSDAQLQSFVTVLVKLAENDVENQAGPIGVFLVNTYREKAVKIIGESDRNQALRRAMTSVSEGKH